MANPLLRPINECSFYLVYVSIVRDLATAGTFKKSISSWMCCVQQEMPQVMAGQKDKQSRLIARLTSAQLIAHCVRWTLLRTPLFRSLNSQSNQKWIRRLLLSATVICLPLALARAKLTKNMRRQLDSPSYWFEVH